MMYWAILLTSMGTTLIGISYMTISTAYKLSKLEQRIISLEEKE